MPAVAVSPFNVSTSTHTLGAPTAASFHGSTTHGTGIAQQNRTIGESPSIMVSSPATSVQVHSSTPHRSHRIPKTTNIHSFTSKPDTTSTSHYRPVQTTAYETHHRNEPTITTSNVLSSTGHHHTGRHTGHHVGGSTTTTHISVMPRSGYVQGEVYVPNGSTMVYVDKPNALCQHYGYDMNAVPSYQKGLVWTDKSIIKNSTIIKSETNAISSSDTNAQTTQATTTTTKTKKNSRGCCGCAKKSKTDK